MPAQTEPRSGIQFGWDLGENGWKPGMDSNLTFLGRVGVHLSIKDRDLTTPPMSPGQGDTYILADGSTGDWSGHDGDVAIWVESSWVFYSPRVGWVAYPEDEEVLSVYKAGGGQRVYLYD